MASWTGSAGYDDETAKADEVLEISDRIRQALECPVCLELSANLKCYCPNGHATCETCLMQLKFPDETYSCPLCRSSLSSWTGGPLTARRLILALPLVKVACTHRRYGCDDLVRVEDIVRHEANCKHSPGIRCLVTTCQWLGTYHQLYDHVHHVHPDAVVDTKDDRLVVTDANRITMIRRRAYLVKTDRGATLLWVLVFRTGRSHYRAGVFLVESEARGPGWRTDITRPTNMAYRITYPDVETRRQRTETRWVGRWYSSPDADDVIVAESYADFRSRTGRVEVQWFKHMTEPCTRSDSIARVMGMHGICGDR